MNSILFRNVPVGEASVVIAISSKHRKESLEAIEFAINTLKATVTIWKKVGHPPVLQQVLLDHIGDL